MILNGWFQEWTDHQNAAANDFDLSPRCHRCRNCMPVVARNLMYEDETLQIEDMEGSGSYDIRPSMNKLRKYHPLSYFIP